MRARAQAQAGLDLVSMSNEEAKGEESGGVEDLEAIELDGGGNEAVSGKSRGPTTNDSGVT